MTKNVKGARFKAMLFAVVISAGALTACSDDDNNATDNGTDNNSTVSDQSSAEM